MITFYCFLIKPLNLLISIVTFYIIKHFLYALKAGMFFKMNIYLCFGGHLMHGISKCELISSCTQAMCIITGLLKFSISLRFGSLMKCMNTDSFRILCNFFLLLFRLLVSLGVGIRAVCCYNTQTQKF